MSIAESQPPRGETLLLAHCSTDFYERPSAYARLVDILGGELARFLLFALSGAHGRRGSSSP